MNLLMEGKMPDRAFDVGIAEGHAVTFSGGMAKDGLQPFCNIYSSFMQRAHDNVIHDIAIQKLPVVLCLDRAGLVGEDGPTHHGAFDMACLRPIPNLTISSPMNEQELRRLMYTAQLPDKGPFVMPLSARTRGTGGLEMSAGGSTGGQRTEAEGRRRPRRDLHRPYRKYGCPGHRPGGERTVCIHSSTTTCVF